MKHQLYLTSVLLFCLAAGRVGAQSTAPYLILKTTYAFAANPQKINEALVYAGDRTYTRGVYGSYARGICLQAGIGKMINPTFGFELSAEMVLGRKVHTELADDTDTLNGNLSARIRSLVFKPMIVIRNSGDLLSIYTKLGLAIATASHLYEDAALNWILGGQGEQVLYSSKESSKAKVGFAASFGLSFRLSESISFFTEVNGQMISLPVSKGHYTSYSDNGVNKLPEMKTSEKSWEYKRAGFFDDTQDQDPNKPGIRLYNPANFSYIGIGVGVTYHF